MTLPSSGLIFQTCVVLHMVKYLNHCHKAENPPTEAELKSEAKQMSEDEYDDEDYGGYGSEGDLAAMDGFAMTGKDPNIDRSAGS